MGAPLTAPDGGPLTLRPVPGLLIVPVRHHSPACAAAVTRLIAADPPRAVLIEMPADLEPHLPLLLDPRTVPPVSLVALRAGPGDGAEEISGIYPVTAHAPELAALRAGQACGAALRCIDLPSAQRIRSDRLDAAQRAQPLDAQPELTSGAYLDALCARVGCRDGHELWDHLFETRIGSTDPEALLTDLLHHCAQIRATTPASRIRTDDTLPREAAMARHLRDALDGPGPVVAVVGGFHAPPLIAAARGWQLPDPEVGPVPPPARVWLARSSEAELDGLSVYGAGLPQPGYYARLWQTCHDGGGPDWRGVVRDILRALGATPADPAALAAPAAPAGRVTPADRDAPSLPAVVETLRMAEGLAQLRGRPGPLRTDLLDAARTALSGGMAQPGGALARLHRTMRGDAIGQVPPEAGQPPLLEAVRTRLAALRFDLTDSRRRHRDLHPLRRRDHARVSAFLQLLDLLEVQFARQERGARIALDRDTALITERWSYAWSGVTEADLVRLAPLGATPETAGLRILRQRLDAMEADPAARDAGQAAAALVAGALAGLGGGLAPLVRRVANLLTGEPQFDICIDALARLERARHHLAARDTGTPPPDLDPLRRAAYGRVLHLLPRLAATPPDRTDAVLLAMRDAPGLAQAVEATTGEPLLAGALTRLARDPDPQNPAIAGGVLALATALDPGIDAILLRAAQGALAGAALTPQARVALLRGAIRADPGILTSCAGLLAALDTAIGALSEDGFLALLPDLRLAFASLPRPQTLRLARDLAQRHGTSPQDLAAPRRPDPAEIAHGARIEAAIAAAIARSGPFDWDTPQ